MVKYNGQICVARNIFLSSRSPQSIRYGYSLEASLPGTLNNYPQHIQREYDIYAQSHWRRCNVMWRCINSMYPLGMISNIRKCTFGYVRPEKIQISLSIHAVWSESLLGTFWIAKYVNFLISDCVIPETGFKYWYRTYIQEQRIMETSGFVFFLFFFFKYNKSFIPTQQSYSNLAQFDWSRAN